MKRYVLITVLMLIVLFMGIGVRGKDVPRPPGNCFWGYVYVWHFPHGPYQLCQGATMKLYRDNILVGTSQTDSQGKYCFWNNAGWSWGDYRIDPRCNGYEKELYRGDDSDIQVDFYLPFACSVPVPPIDVEPVHGEHGDPQP